MHPILLMAAIRHNLRVFSSRVTNRVRCIRYSHFWSEGTLDDKQYCLRCSKSRSLEQALKEANRILQKIPVDD